MFLSRTIYFLQLMFVHKLVQDHRVETYLQSQEEEGTDMLTSIQAWALNATASLQQFVQQALPARPQQLTPDDYEEVSMATVLCGCTMLHSVDGLNATAAVLCLKVKEVRQLL